MTRFRFAILMIVGFLSTLLVGPLPGQAAPPPPDCKTVATTLSRPDHGHGTVNGGFWANLVIKRTTKFCVVPDEAPVAKEVSPPDTVHYKATVTDEGTLTTIAGATLSPNNAAVLTGGVKGKVKGGFTQDLFAPAGWLNYQGNFNGQSYSGLNNPASTGEWVAKVWGGEVKTEGLNNNWWWLYWLCGDQPDLVHLDDFEGEYWWDAAVPASDDGQTVLAGDILGKQVCATPSASASVSASVSASTPAVVPVGNDGLPLTGTPVWTLVWIGGGVVLVGTVLLMVGKRRRRRMRFVA